MLVNDLFQILSVSDVSGQVLANIKFDPAHRIFDGHFPGMPIVPGVCMMQLVKEAVQIQLAKQIRLRRADQIKFLAVIEPLKIIEVDLKFTYSVTDEKSIKVSAEISKDDKPYFKLKAVYDFI